MAGQFFELHKVTDFAPGIFENTAVENGSIQLGRRAGRHAERGVYTSVAFHSEAFFSLMPSWNADTPPGTTVEMQVRLSVEGKWSRWFSFGVWSPYIDHATPAPETGDLAQVERGTLSVLDGMPAATMAQLRVVLATEDTQHSPRVYRLAVATNAIKQLGQGAPAFARVLELPAYSCLNRDPAIAGRNASLTSLTMLMNRWGRDLLPEEVARLVYDFGAGHYGNLSFLCAAAGVYGFACTVTYAGLGALRREIWQGRALGARVRYRAPGLAEDGAPEAGAGALLPVLEGATHSSSGHLVAVCGFVQRENQEYVVIHDPMAPASAAVRREIPLSRFREIYTGIALFLQPGPRGGGTDAPRRRHASIVFEEGTLRMLDEAGEELVPARLADGSLKPATLCYTLSDGVAYASAAQRKFYYPGLDTGHQVRFDATATAGNKLTLYLIGPRGQSWVAEKLPPLPEALSDDQHNKEA
ncbi:MAG: hypothetical protein GXY32_07765 [Ruminococcaceae bacterium]|nr:hypothetical protein [Oscillospiraceae bacterium]